MRKYLEANIEHNTLNMPKETWLKLRKKGIGGSDASSILNLNPYKQYYSMNYWNDNIQPMLDGKFDYFLTGTVSKIQQVRK